GLSPQGPIGQKWPVVLGVGGACTRVQRAWEDWICTACTEYSQGHEEDLGCREWGIPESPREYLEGGGVRECPGERGPGGNEDVGGDVGRAGGVPETGENRSHGKKVKNEWEHHMTREHGGPELSASEVQLDSTKASRWENQTEKQMLKRQTIEPEVSQCGT
ncbi:hypothetical protein EDD17DRAFT_1512075, partial [Pisolithus thermaeus]